MQVKRWIIAGAALALLTTTASAQVNLYSGGNWSTSYYPVAAGQRSEPICVASTAWPWPSGAGMLMFKWQPSLGLFLHISKQNWRLPPGTEVPVTISFDSGARSATGFVTEKGTVQVGVDEDAAAGFMEDFANAREVTISFPEGDEPTWKGAMNGSRVAGRWLDACISKVRADYKVSTSPVAPKTAQPTSPVNPKAQPAKRVDKGDI